MSYGVYGRGDYGVHRGDPGVFSWIAKRAKAFLHGGPLGMAASMVAGRQRPTGPAVVARPGIRAAAERFFPGGKTGLMVAPGQVAKRRRMNVANPKALRRAIRRQSGFVKLAKKALKGSGYTVTARGAGRRRGPISIMESGRGGVQVRS